MSQRRPRLRTVLFASLIFGVLIVAAEHALPPSNAGKAIPGVGQGLVLRAANSPRALRGESPSRTSPARIRSVRTPLAFEPVGGAAAVPGGFLARGPGYTVLVTGDGAALSLGKLSRRSKVEGQRSKLLGQWKPAVDSKAETASVFPPLLRNPMSALNYGAGGGSDGRAPSPATEPPDVLQVKFLGASRRATVVGMEKLPGKSNYFFGRDPKKWRTNVPHFARVKIKDVYPGVDVVYYGNQGQLEYDFLVAPGADPRAITLAVAPVSPPAAVAAMSPPATVAAMSSSPSGGRRPPLQVDANGDLVIKADGGEVRFHKPVVYQTESTVDSQQSKASAGNGRRTMDARHSSLVTRHFLDGRYVLTADSRVHFEIPRYDKTRPLVIDPVLVYSTYLGGADGASPYGGVAVDSTGNILVSGATTSTDFPTTSGSYQPDFQCSTAPGGCTHTFITKFDPTGESLIYSTFLGGTIADGPNGLAVDSNGNAFVTGGSISTDFPLVNPTPTNYTSGTCDTFVAELSAAGDQLLYSSCFTGTQAGSIVVDSGDNVYVAGSTTAPNFPVTAGAFQTSYSGSGDFFVSKLRPDGSPLLASTFLGSPVREREPAIAVDSADSPYLVGITAGTTFPTTPGAFDTAPATGCNTVIAKLKPDFSALAYSTYLCAESDSGVSIAVDSSGDAYVAGSISSPIFPATAGAFQTAFGGVTDGYVAKIDPTGATLVYGTYIGGDGLDYAHGIAIDAGGQAYIAGADESSNFPTVNAFQPTSLPNNISVDSFVAVFNSEGSGLIYSTLLGGTSSDRGQGLALSPSGNVVVFGDTNSLDFPLVKPYQNALSFRSAGLNDSYVAIISPIAAPGATLLPTAVNFPNQNVGTTSAVQFATLLNVGSQPLAITSIAATGDFTETNTCPSTIAVGGNCSVKITFSPTVPGDLTGSLVVTDNALDSPQSFTLSGTSLGAAVSTSPASIVFPNQFVGTTGLPENVTLMNTGTIPLTITAVQATGDFAAVNGCTSSVAPGVNCTIGVFFDPSATGLRTGTLTIANNAPDSPQTIALSGTGEDFSMALQTSTLAAPAGMQVNVPLTLNPAGGFDVPVVLTCSGAPALSTCNVNPSSTAMNGTSPVNVTVTIQTTASSSAPSRWRFPPSPQGWERTLMLGLMLLLLFLSLATGKRRRTLLVRLGVVSLLFLAAFWSGCGGTAAPRGPRTPAGKYTLAVTGIAASGPATLSHTVPLDLTVQ